MLCSVPFIRCLASHRCLCCSSGLSTCGWSSALVSRRQRWRSPYNETSVNIINSTNKKTHRPSQPRPNSTPPCVRRTLRPPCLRPYNDIVRSLYSHCQKCELRPSIPVSLSDSKTTEKQPFLHAFAELLLCSRSVFPPVSKVSTELDLLRRNAVVFLSVRLVESPTRHDSRLFPSTGPNGLMTVLHTRYMLLREDIVNHHTRQRVLSSAPEQCYRLEVKTDHLGDDKPELQYILLGRL